jgi:hypothetical protein
MTDRPRWGFTPEDWRLLAITFIGGLASILAGAALIGISIAIARSFEVHSWLDWVLLIVGTIIAVGLQIGTLTIVIPKDVEGMTPRVRILLLVMSVSLSSVVVLGWIGLAVGIK